MFSSFAVSTFMACVATAVAQLYPVAGGMGMPRPMGSAMSELGGGRGLGSTIATGSVAMAGVDSSIPSAMGHGYGIGGLNAGYNSGYQSGYPIGYQPVHPNGYPIGSPAGYQSYPPSTGTGPTNGMGGMGMVSGLGPLGLQSSDNLNENSNTNTNTNVNANGLPSRRSLHASSKENDSKVNSSTSVNSNTNRLTQISDGQ